MPLWSSKCAVLVVAASLFAPGACWTAAAQRGGVRKPANKKPDAAKKQDPSSSSYTPAPLQPLPLDQTPAVAPEVKFADGQLSIVAHNSTLADVLRAVKKQTGAEFEVPPNATERVVADIGPGRARDVMAELLNGTHYNYVMVGSSTDPSAVQNIILTPKTGGAAETTASATPSSRPGVPSRAFPGGLPLGQAGHDDSQMEENSADSDDGDQSDAPEEAQDQPAQQPPGQQTPKTPEQLLQELQRAQQQAQQSQGQSSQSSQPQSQPGLFPNLPPTQAPPSKPD